MRGDPSTRRVDRALRAVGAITQAVLDGEPIDALLERIAAEARDLVGARVGVVATTTGPTIAIRAVAGRARAPIVAGATMPAAGSVTDAVVRSGGTFVARTPAEVPSAGRRLMRSNGLATLIAAPLGGGSAERGVLIVGDGTEHPPFESQDAVLIEAFAAQAATALQLSDLRAIEAGLALAADRQRIARDLHDGVVQDLFGIGMGLRALADRTPDDVLADHLSDVIQRLDDAIAAIRRFIGQLGGAPDDGTGSLDGPDRGAPRIVGAPRTDGAPRIDGAPPLPADPIAAIGHLARASALAADEDDVLARMLEGASRAVDGYGLVGLLSEDGLTATVRARTGPEAPGRSINDVVPIARTLIGPALKLGRPLVINDFDSPMPEVSDALRAQLSAVVTVPLLIRGRAFGALSVRRDRGSPPFEPDEVALIEAFAVQAAIALEFERVRREIRRGAVTAERDRIGRELHEQVIQALFIVGMALQGLEGTTDDGAAREVLRGTVDELDRAMRDLRRYVFDLGPSLIVERRFHEEVEHLARSLLPPAGIEIELAVDPAVTPLLGGTAPDVVQIVREALSNVARHSGARWCGVRARRDDGAVVVEIVDDGGRAPGLRPARPAVPGSGRGLTNMRTRADRIGAALDIRGPGPDGTAVTLRALAADPAGPARDGPS